MVIKTTKICDGCMKEDNTCFSAKIDITMNSDLDGGHGGRCFHYNFCSLVCMHNIFHKHIYILD